MEKPVVLTTFGRYKCNYHKCFNNKHLIPAKDGQFSPARSGQGHWLFQYMPVPRLDKKPLEKVYGEVGDNGIVRGFVWGDQAGCWQHAACLMDINYKILVER